MIYKELIEEMRQEIQALREFQDYDIQRVEKYSKNPKHNKLTLMAWREAIDEKDLHFINLEVKLQELESEIAGIRVEVLTSYTDLPLSTSDKKENLSKFFKIFSNKNILNPSINNW